VGERTAEEIKIAVGSAIKKLHPGEEPEDYILTGPNIVTALPRTISLNYSEIASALDKSLLKIDAAIMKVLENIPSELYSDIYRKGVYLAGGGALIRGIAQRFSNNCKIPFIVADDPLRSVARGTNKALENIGKFSFLTR
jgi:rod shape-determining protein MreB